MIVIAEKWFQLGNRLFAMSHFIAAAIENGFCVANPAFEDYASHFETTRQDPWCRFPPRRSKWVKLRPLAKWIEKPAVFVSHLVLRHHLNTPLWRAMAVGIHDEFRLDSDQFKRWAKRSLLLFPHGWSFRDPNAFNRQAESIREYFRPVQELCARVNATETKARQGCDVLVGVHIRQGDYKEHLGGKFYYESSDYAELMRKVLQLFPGQRVGFVVCSNAPQDPVHFDGFRWIAGDGHLVVDMYSFAQCDFIIGPPSTFTQWASFYGQKPLCIVRHPKQTISMHQFVIFAGGMSHT